MTEIWTIMKQYSPCPHSSKCRAPACIQPRQGNWRSVAALTASDKPSSICCRSISEMPASLSPASFRILLPASLADTSVRLVKVLEKLDSKVSTSISFLNVSEKLDSKVSTSISFLKVSEQLEVNDVFFLSRFPEVFLSSECIVVLSSLCILILSLKVLDMAAFTVSVHTSPPTDMVPGNGISTRVGSLSQDSVPHYFPVLHTSNTNIGYLLNITFIFDRCRKLWWYP